MSRKEYRILSIIILLCFLVFFQDSDVSAKAAENDDLPNIIIVTLSGVRRSDSIDDPVHQYMPHLWTEMIKEGVMYTDVPDKNLEFHMPAVQAINTGKTQLSYHPIDVTSIFQLIRKKYHWPASKVWSIGHWQITDCCYSTEGFKEETFPAEFIPLGLYCSPEMEAILNKQEFAFLKTYRSMTKEEPESWPTWSGVGLFEFQLFKKIIKIYKPKFVHYVMGNPEVAHYDTFGSYVIALKISDKEIFEIWRMIQEDPYYKGRTYLIVTPDAGRNLYYKFHEDNAFDNPSHVWLYFFGPDVKRGKVIRRPIDHVDIFATAAYLMRLKTDPREGKVLKDAF